MDSKTMINQISKCPTYNKAVSINVKPSVLTGFTGISKTESSWRPGNHIFTNFLTYKLALGSLSQVENRFGYGVTYSRNKESAPENAEDNGINTVSKPTFCTYLETNLNNDISYKLCHNVFGNLWGQISGNVLDNWTKSKISGSIELANDNLNVQVLANKATDTSNELNINFTKQIFSSSVIGGQCTFIAGQKSPIPMVLKGYEGMLGYREGYMSYSATLNQSLASTLRAVARHNSNSTALEVKCEYEKREIKCVLSQQAVVTKDIEVKGKCPTHNKAVLINVKPSALSGYAGNSKIESYWRPGDPIFVNYLTYNLALGLLNQIENRFGYGVTYSRNKDSAPENAEDDGINTVSKPTFCTYLETNLNNDISYKLCHNVFGNLWGQIGGNVLENWTKSKISGSIEFANEYLNVQVLADETTDTSYELNINFTKQIFSSCVIGGQCTFIADKKSPIPIVLKDSTASRKFLQEFLQDIPPPINGPVFDKTVPSNVTGLVGRTAYLHCRVKNLGNRTVSWIRHRDIHLLTAGRYTYTSDQRFEAIHEPHSENWSLRIKYPQKKDTGIYECQISTTPPIGHNIYLTVLEPTTEILGGPELYIDQGSTINLTCLVQFAPEPPPTVGWTHEKQPINFDSPRGGISLVTEKGSTTSSRLLIQKASSSDTGYYSCDPSNANSATVRVHILNGEHPAAMHHGQGSIPLCPPIVSAMIVPFLLIFTARDL